MNVFRFALTLTMQIVLGAVASAAITDLSTWTMVQDPAHPGLTATATTTSATLSAGNLAIPAGTDIGFQSVDGSTPTSSSHGFYFSPDTDFSLAIDYAWSFSNSPTGFLALGFGIGEDGDGMNSAGVGMATNDGSPFLTFAGAARINDVDQPALALGNPIFNPSTLSGTLFVAYNSASGNVVVGASPAPGAVTPTVLDSFDGIQNQWSGGNLMASFFIRSDDPSPLQAWSGGNADAIFSNFRVLSGSPVAIPEPSTAIGTVVLAGMILLRRPGRQRRLRESRQQQRDA